MLQRLFVVYSFQEKNIHINIEKLFIIKEIIHITQHNICNQLSLDMVLHDVSGFA